MASCTNIIPGLDTDCTHIENPGPIQKIEIDEKEKLVYIQYRHKAELELYGKLLALKKYYMQSEYHIRVYVEVISENKYLDGKKCVIEGFFTYTGFVRQSSIEIKQ